MKINFVYAAAAIAFVLAVYQLKHPECSPNAVGCNGLTLEDVRAGR